MKINVKTSASPTLNELQPVTVIELNGDVDTNTAPLVQEQILPQVKAGSKIILDMTQVSYLSSAGLRMLLSLYRQIFNQNAQIILVGLSEEIADTMSITGFLDFFQTADTLNQALEALNAKVQFTHT
ncbi:anti-sigma-factor antagonist (plasmid) [Nostoc sp. NIES-3756]|uniref:anti-sigma factor antagonist n=1 Tax=Nostoc sp. NIES-3756 TaxID=1751286 RepID=UPI000720B1C5|nr:anti-sigma factor antagonist [Nostoc sp. NIES-3756]BAT56919.1 anti-sigma-factor antagonist [Nostoc sp. NIES-3756]